MVAVYTVHSAKGIVWSNVTVWLLFDHVAVSPSPGERLADRLV